MKRIRRRSVAPNRCPVEPLERRVLLDGADPLRLDWQGRETLARPDEWIVRLGSGANQPAGAGAAAAMDARLSIERALGNDGTYLVRSQAGLELEQVQAALRSLPGFQYAEPNFLVHAQETTPADPFFDQLWGLHNTGQTGGTVDADIDAPQAWDIARGDGSVIVGVLDTGVDLTHPDLYLSIWINPAEIPPDRRDHLTDIDQDGQITFRDLNHPANQGPGKITDQNGNGIIDARDLLAPWQPDGSGGWADGINGVLFAGDAYVDDLVGWDFVNDDNDPTDVHGHGTHVAGTIAADADNGVGITGVSWRARIVPLAFLDSRGSGEIADAVLALDYATGASSAGMNLRLTNNSWGGGPFSQAMRDAIARSADAGMLFIAAAGNEASNNDATPHYPSGYALPNVIAVAATDHKDSKAAFSNYGATTVHLAAPGAGIYSANPGGGYGQRSGTSMAAPHVAGTAALAWTLQPDASYQAVRGAILDGVDVVPGLAGLTTTGGRLNAVGALRQLGMLVVGSTPAVGQIVTAAPTQFAIRFSEAYAPASVQAADLRVNGIPAGSVALTDATTLTFSFGVSPVQAQGPQTLSIAAGAILRMVDSEPVTAFSGRFLYDQVRLAVSGMSPANGALVTLPLSVLRVDFNEAVDPLTVGVDDVQISDGAVMGATVVDADTVQYALDGITQEGALLIRMAAGAVADVYGNPMLAFAGDVVADIGTKPLAAALAPIGPAMGLIHEATTSVLIGWVGDADTLALSLDAGQTLSVRASPAAGLALAVELRDPSGTLIASAAGAAGTGAVLQTVGLPVAGAYTITLRGMAGTGRCDVAVALNAAVDAGAHDTPARAQDIDGSFIDIGHLAQRGAVLSRSTPSMAPLLVAGFENGNGGFEIEAGGGGLWHLSTGHGGEPGHSPQRSFYFGQGEGPAGGGHYSTGARSSGGIVSPAIALPASGRITLDFNYILVTEKLAGYDLAQVQIDAGAGWSTLATYSTVAESSAWAAAPTIELSAYAGKTIRLRWFFDTVDGSTNQYEGWYVDDIIVRAQQRLSDYYRFRLDAGQSTAVALEGLFGSGAEVTLLDPQGLVLATGTPNATEGWSLIRRFEVEASGQYLLRVDSDGGTSYSLVLTRDAVIDAEPNDLLSTAQDVGPSGIALGALTERVVTVVTEDFESGTLGGAWTSWSSAAGGRIQVTDAYGQGSGAYALLMDRYPGGQAVLNEATWTVDLSGHASAVLSFFHAAFKDDAHGFAGSFTGHYNADGIAISGDGLRWHPIWSPPQQADGAWTPYTVDLSAEAAKHGVSLEKHLHIRFQQYDNRELVEDGRGWDGIVIGAPSAVRDVYVLPVRAGDRIELGTLTPGDGALAFDNTLDPRLELFDPFGDLVAMDDNGADDGRNAQLTWIAESDGEYRVRVSAAGQTHGQYVLSALAVPAAPTAPAAPDLLAASDTGASQGDDLTRLDNSSPGAAMEFLVGGVIRGATVTLYSDGVAIGSTIARSNRAMVRGDGARDLGDGPHRITATQALGGTGSGESAALQLIVDTTAPPAPSLQLQAGSDTGLSNTDRVTADSTPTFVIGGAAFFRFYRDEEIISGDYESGGGYTPQAQPDGVYAFTAVAVDAAGNPSPASAAVHLTIDTLPPPAPAALDLPAEQDSGLSDADNITNRSALVLSVTAGPYFRVYVDGLLHSQPYATGSTYSVGALADGTRSFVITSVDRAGNESPLSEPVLITIDRQAPAPPPAPDLRSESDGGALDDDNITNDTTPTFDLPGASYFRFFRDGARISALYEPGDSFTAPPQAAGTYAYTVVYVDAAGNASATSAALQVTIDPTILSAPQLAGQSDTGLSSQDRLTSHDNRSPATALRVTVGGTIVGAVVRLYADGVLIGQATAASSSTLIITDGASALGEGVVRITARQQPPAGLEGSESTPLWVTIDTQAPAQPPAPDLADASDSGVSSTDNITSDSTPTINLPAGGYYRLFLDGRQVGDDYASGSYTLEPLADGTYAVTVAAVDPAGNVSAVSPPLWITIDTAAPAPPGAPDLRASSDTGVLDNDNLTRAVSPTLDVIGAPFFRVYREGVLISGPWESGPAFTAPPLPDGAHALTARAVDIAGNVSGPSAALLVTIDTAAPTVRGGTLDVGWAGQGIAISSLSGGAVQALARQADGRIIAAGTAGAQQDGFGLARYNPDGSLDGTFGQGGTVISRFRFKDELRAVAIQDDGKIVAGGYSAIQIAGGYATQFALARYRPDGSLDEDFGQFGLVTTEIGTGQSLINTVAILPDGRILAAGYGWNQGNPEFALAQYLPDGTLDPSFGSGGMVLTDIAGLWDEAHDLALMPDGRFVVAGWASTGGGYTIALARYLPDGSLDTSFDRDGKLTTHIGAYSDYGNAVEIDAAGRIIVAGTTFPDALSPSDMVVLRYNDDGSPDRSFGGTGYVITSIGLTYDGAADVAVDADGRIIAAGSAVDPVSRRTAFAVVRHRPDGLLDPQFGTNGVVITQADPSGGSRANAVLVEPNGQILAGGLVGAASGGGFAVARYDGGQTPRAPDLTADSDTGPSATDNITRTSEPTLSIPPTDQFYRVYVNGALLGDAYRAGSPFGTTFKAPALTDGTYAFTLVLLDAAGNRTEPSAALHVTIDTVAPSAPPAARLIKSSDTGANNRDSLTADRTPTLAIAAGPYYHVYRNGLNASGAFESAATYTVGALPDGAYRFTITAIDEAGNESPASAPLDVTIDTTAPSAATVALAPASDSGISNTDGITNALTPQFEVVTGEAGVIELRGDGRRLGRVTAPSGGKWMVPAQGTEHALGPTFAAGNAVSIKTADFNGDGRADLALAQGATRALWVLLGNGDGSFKPPVVLGTVGEAMDLVVADFNKDNRLDVAACNGIDSRVSVFLGNGDGTFQAQRLVSGSANASTILAADLNGDGLVDLATNDPGNARIAILLGRGDGTFQPVRFVAPVVDGWRLFSGDLNGDGRADLAALSRQSGSIAVMLGNGDATFAPPVAYATGTYPVAIAGGDVDGDGVIDLLTADRDGNGVSVLPGNGDGTFQPRASMPVAGGPEALSLADFDADGRLDLAVASGAGVALWRGLGNGAFEAAGDFAAGASPRGIASGDFNGDGQADFVTTTGATLLSRRIVFADGGHSFSAIFEDLAGNRAAASVPAAITIDRTPPAADIVDVAPDPRPFSVDQVTIQFTEPVLALGLGDLLLTRNGQPVPLGAGQSLSIGPDARTWALSGLWRLTFVRGGYELRLRGRPTDVAGNALAADASDLFTVQTTLLPATSSADAYRMQLNPAGTAIEIFHNTSPLGEPSYLIPLADAASIELDTLGGDDALTIDPAHGDPLAQTTLRLRGGTLRLAAEQTIRVGGLEIDPAARVDLGDGSLLIDSASPADIRALILSARDHPSRWLGPGLGSSAAHLNPNTTLAMAQVGAGMRVKYTWTGDANLDGVVNADDYFRIDSAYLSQPADPAYTQGNFNLDSVINADDYFLIDLAFLAQTGPLGAPIGPPVSPAAAPRSAREHLDAGDWLFSTVPLFEPEAIIPS